MNPPLGHCGVLEVVRLILAPCSCLPKVNFCLHIVVARTLTFIQMWLSWHGVEQMALRFKPVKPA